MMKKLMQEIADALDHGRHESEHGCIYVDHDHIMYDGAIDTFGIIRAYRAIERYKTTGATGMNNEEKGDNWHERGELPPVGGKAKLRIDDKICEVDVIAYHGSGGSMRAWVYNMGRGYRTALPDRLRPIQTERDKVIEAAHAILGKSNREWCEMLYDAGMLKLPTD